MPVAKVMEMGMHKRRCRGGWEYDKIGCRESEEHALGDRERALDGEFGMETGSRCEK